MNALRRAHSNEGCADRSQHRDPVLINIGLSGIYNGHPVRSTCDVIGLGHLRSHLHYVGKRGIVRDDVRATELLHEKIGDRYALPGGVLGQIR